MRALVVVAAVSLLLVAGAAQAYLVTVTKSSATVGTSSSQVLAANSGRAMLKLVNASDVNIDCAYGEAAVTGEGDRLSAAGGGVFYDVAVPAGAVFCVAESGSGKAIVIMEGTR